MKRKPLPKPRSLAARALESPLFRMQKVKTLKGKGSYKRRPQHRGGVSVFVRATMRFPNLRAQTRFPSVGFQLLSRRDAVRPHASLL